MSVNLQKNLNKFNKFMITILICVLLLTVLFISCRQFAILFAGNA